MKQTLVLGGPGCGKTTKLLDILESVLASGIPPSEIAFLAFTRKAAHEARERAAVRFNLTEDELPYFKTLHALAFSQLGLTTSEVMGKNDYATIGKALGWQIGEADEDSGTHVSQDTMGEKVAFLEQMSRLTDTSVEDICAGQVNERYWDVRLYSDTLSAYKKSRHAFDFTDMLSVYLDRGPFPDLRVVFVDEAQDLSPIQWRLVHRVFEKAEQVFIGGDDDQAIYEWSGADVKQFLELKGDRIVLPKSHRLPSVIFQQAVSILGRIGSRFPKNWTFAAEGGTIDHYESVDYINTQEGSWLYLARNRYMLSTFTDYLRERGHPYWLLGQSSVDNDRVRSLVCWEQLRRGKKQPEKLVKLMLGQLRAGHGTTWKSVQNQDGAEVQYSDLKGLTIPITEDWMTAIRMTDVEREYYRAILRNGESLINPPKTTVSTIHQVKGGEADHVVLASDMSYSCYSSLQTNPDSEHRVFYVGATRAKKSLHIIYPTTTKFYEI